MKPRREKRPRSSGEARLRTLASACCAGAPRWSLQDAKAKFSEVVQRALDGEPQRISRHGKDAVVIVSYAAIVEALHPPRNLFDFLQSSPFADVDLAAERMAGELREVDL